MVKRTVPARHLIPLVMGLGIFGATNAVAANEQRCVELGANCICSEPLNTNRYSNPPGLSSWFDPADTTTSDKQCSTISAAAGGFVEDGAGFRYQTVNTGEAISNLPSGRTNTWILRTNDGAGGQFMGQRFSSGAPTARRSFRFYKYYSSNYGWVGGSCLNGNKYAQLLSSSGGGGPIFTETAGTWSFYALETSTGWDMNANGCCSGPGPGASGSGPALAAIRGKWIRYEIVLRNATTSGTSNLLVYMKNVTDNTPEITLVDTSVPTTMSDGVNWTSALASGITQTRVHDLMVIDAFRNGTCTGFAGFTHYLAAAWSTDAGQRIGAATEIESPPGNRLPAPGNLRIQ